MQEVQVLMGESKSSTFAGIMKSLDELGFKIPLIDEPTNAINLLLGHDVDLFTWDMPGMGMSAEIQKHSLSIQVLRV